MRKYILKIIQPTSYSIIQRSLNNSGSIKIQGRLKISPLQKFRLKKELDQLQIEIQIEPINTSHESNDRAITRKGLREFTFSNIISIQSKNGSFQEIIQAPIGWYKITVNLLINKEKKDSIQIQPVGVGDIFITAGQSNSANSGAVHLKAEYDPIVAYGPKGWQHADDPQPITNGTGGTCWPAMGNYLYRKTMIPVGFISVGVGGSPMSSWVPKTGKNYNRLKNAVKICGINGARAILWHQGESDSLAKTSTEKYLQMIRQTIQQTRIDAGWEIPWIIAQAAFHTQSTQDSIDNIIRAQTEIVDNKTIFQGPNTDLLVGLEWRNTDLVHFNEKGQWEHGRRWAEIILQVFLREFSELT